MGLRGERLLRLRKERGITQTELGERLGVTQNQISRYERGAVNPSVETLIQLTQILNTSADYLLGLSPNPNPDSDLILTRHQIEMLDLMQRGDDDAQARLVQAVRLLWHMD